MKIKEYIKELLFTNQGVIIPGLGGFISEYEPAAFDVNENKFLPPTKKITFRTDYSFYDKLLIDFISKNENIDENEAKILLKDFVEDAKAKLKKGEKIEFPQVGYMTQTSKGKLSFTQDKESNLLADSFGLKSIKTNTIVTDNNNKVTINASSESKLTKKKKIIIVSSGFLFLCLVIFSWFLTEGYSDFKFISSNNEVKPVAKRNILIKENTEKYLDSISKADSIKAIINQSIDENTDKKDALFYNEPQKKEPSIKYSEFHIIAGSFKRMENAKKFSSELKKEGYEPEIIQSGENLFRISIYTYTNETAALKKLYKLREESNIKSVWILKSI